MPLLKKRGNLESNKVLFLPVDAIVPNPEQPRRVFDHQELEELATSIQALGLLQPLTVRRVGTSWELVAGERRLRAAKLAGLKEVPCLSLNIDSEQSSLLALVENLQRKDLDFLEEAMALSRLISTYHLSQEEAAKRIGKSQSAVANKLRLLKLPATVLEALQTAGATERHARALLPLKDPKLQQEAAFQAIEQQMTVAETEHLVEALMQESPPAKPERKQKKTFIVKDIRIFLNTLTRGIRLMESAGIHADCHQEERDNDIVLTIQIPKQSDSSKSNPKYVSRET